MHINSNHKDIKIQSMNNSQLNDGNSNNLVYNTVYKKNQNSNVHRNNNEKNNTSIVYNSDLLNSVNKSHTENEGNSLTTNGNIDTSIIKNGEWTDFIKTNVNKVISSSVNLNESNDMINYQNQNKNHSSSPVLYPLPSNTAISLPSPMVVTPTISSTLSNTHLSPLFSNNKTNKPLINKNNSCLHVPRLIKSPILQKVSSITLPSIDNNDHSINSAAN